MTYKTVITEVHRLSQEEGYFDDEIANELGCSRATVNKIRKQYNIPKVNLDYRKDKSYVCAKCGKQVYIRRLERRRLYCEDCR